MEIIVFVSLRPFPSSVPADQPHNILRQYLRPVVHRSSGRVTGLSVYVCRWADIVNNCPILITTLQARASSLLVINNAFWARARARDSTIIVIIISREPALRRIDLVIMGVVPIHTTTCDPPVTRLSLHFIFFPYYNIIITIIVIFEKSDDAGKKKKKNKRQKHSSKRLLYTRNVYYTQSETFSALLINKQ